MLNLVNSDIGDFICWEPLPSYSSKGESVKMLLVRSSRSTKSLKTYKHQSTSQRPCSATSDCLLTCLLLRPTRCLWRRSNKHLLLCCSVTAPSQSPVTLLPARKFIGPLLEVSEPSVSIKPAVMFGTPSQRRFTSLTDTPYFKVPSGASSRAGATA